MPLTKLGPDVVTVPVKPQLTVVVGVPTAMSDAHSTVASDGHVIVGAAFDKVNVCVQTAVLPHSSVTVYSIS